jgi:hypothetical protein
MWPWIGRGQGRRVGREEVPIYPKEGCGVIGLADYSLAPSSLSQDKKGHRNELAS